MCGAIESCSHGPVLLLEALRGQTNFVQRRLEDDQYAMKMHIVSIMRRFLSDSCLPMLMKASRLYDS